MTTFANGVMDMNLERLLSRIMRGLYFLPKTLYINFRALPLKRAIKFPIIVMGSTSFAGIKKGVIEINEPITTGMIRIAAQKTGKRGLQVGKKTCILVYENGKIQFRGKASIGQGTGICAKNGIICFGDNYSCNVNCFIYSQKGIYFGNDVLMGWNINIRDNDGHPMYNSAGDLVNPDKVIEIGDHVWVASYVDTMKGVKLAVGTIVGSRSLVTKSNEMPNVVIGGVPARVIKDNIYWEHE